MIFQDNNNQRKSVNDLIKEVFIDSKEGFSNKYGQESVMIVRTDKKFDPNAKLREPNRHPERNINTSLHKRAEGD